MGIVDNDGNVTGIAKGTTTIMVTTEDGGKVATCEVTVNDTQVIITCTDKIDIEKNKILIYNVNDGKVLRGGI